MYIYVYMHAHTHMLVYVCKGHSQGQKVEAFSKLVVIKP